MIQVLPHCQARNVLFRVCIFSSKHIISIFAPCTRMAFATIVSVYAPEWLTGPHERDLCADILPLQMLAKY